MKRMIGGVVAFVPSYNTVFSFYIEFRFIVLAASTQYHSFQRRFHVTMKL